SARVSALVPPPRPLVPTLFPYTTLFRSDDRVASLNRTIRDSEELNTSVIEIMKAVGTIATMKDLGVRVPVTENVTGAIADALNLDRKSTRLNSSHVKISYAVFCLKKKKD